ncbi:MAG: 50S ribosomal protein L19, partial [Deltaproteobacteria bacterium]|nr:50S ribosomal protein L19 [Deltaproteobacteria bacterium]
MSILSEIEKEYLKTDIPLFRAGDTVIVNVKIKEGEKERVQAFEGVVLRR